MGISLQQLSRGLVRRARRCFHPRAVVWRWLRLWRPEQPLIVPLGDSLRIRARPCDVVGRHIFVDGYFEPAECRFVMRFLRPGMVFVDAGAGLGQYTLLAARQVGRAGKVHSFEPGRVMFRELEFNVALNNLGDVCVLNRVALTDRPGTAALSVTRPGAEAFGSLGAHRRRGVPVHGHEEVPTTTLDAYVAAQGIGRLDLIKMDIEGAELLALRGGRSLLTRPEAPTLVLEMADVNTQGFGYKALETWEYLESLGYRMYSFDAQGRIAGPAPKPRDFAAYQDLVAIPAGARAALDGGRSGPDAPRTPGGRSPHGP